MVSTAKIVGSIEREVRTLSTTVDTLATQLLATHPDAGLTVRRTPNRVVLQAGQIGVSVSVFRSRAGDDAGVDLMLAVWDGEVTLPGETQHGFTATQLSEQQFHIVAQDEASEDTSWIWMDDTTTHTLSSQALAAVCIETMAARLT